MAQSFGAKPTSPLTPRMIELVQSSWAKVRPISDAAATLFYDHLFELDPSVRSLFKNDMGEQKKKLMHTLTVAVDGLRNLDKLVPVLEDLGVRHAGYMVQEHHYDLVGESLLWTLQEGLGDAFTSEVKTAWVAVYDVVAGVMKRAAAEENAIDDNPTMLSPPSLLSSQAAAPARPSTPAKTPAWPPGREQSPGAGKSGSHPRTVPRSTVLSTPVPAPAPAPAPASSGPFDRHTIELVQSSWAKVRPISDAAATLFYDHLFELDPAVRSLFKHDMGEQKKKLMQTLTVAVDGLRNVDKLIPVLEDLGVRHAGYMVQEHHYDLVGESLLWTLQEGLGDEFTAEVKTAWIAVYTVIASVMKGAAAAHTRKPDDGQVTVSGPAPVAQGASRPAVPAPLPPAPVARPAPPPPAPAPAPAASGPVDARTIQLVQASWAKVRPISDAAATLFYDHLFTLDPSVRPLFKSDMSEQKKKLMQTLSVAVDGLNSLDRLVPVLRDLGIRHAGYMVQEHHYDHVGAALLWTLQEGLGDEFTDEVKAAWVKVYDVIAGVMKDAAAETRGGSLATEATMNQASPPPPTGKRAAAVEPPTMPHVFHPSARAGAPASHSSPAEPAPDTAQPGGVKIEFPRHLVLSLDDRQAPLRLHVTLDPPAEPEAAGKKGPSGLAIAVLVALICGAAVLTASSVLLYTVSDMAPPAANVPAFMLYLPPLAATVLTFTAFLLGFLWHRQSSSRGRK